MQNTTCQDQNARILAARDQLAKLKASADSWASHSAYLDALMAASDVLAMAEWDARNRSPENLAISASGRFMTFEHDQDKDPAIIAYTRELFARFFGLDADKRLYQYIRTRARHLLYATKSDKLSYHQLQLVRSRRQWLLHLQSIGEGRGPAVMVAFMARVIVEAHSTATA